MSTLHFTDKELECHCGCGMLPATNFQLKLETLRQAFDAPLTITSAARCPDYNEKVSHTGRTGPHTQGRAVDIAIRGGDALKLVTLALTNGFTGIGVSQKGDSRFIHLDDLSNKDGQPRPWIWSY
jgi:zinc D-Ala-D-Ala carboxypeptidase